MAEALELPGSNHDWASPAADRRAQKPGLMMASIYRTLLREIDGVNAAIAIGPLQVEAQRLRGYTVDEAMQQSIGDGSAAIVATRVLGVAVGGVDEVLEQDVRGELRKKVFG